LLALPYFVIAPHNQYDVWVPFTALPENARIVLSSRQLLASGSVMVNLPVGYGMAPAQGNGLVFRPIGGSGDANIIRVMAPNQYTSYPYIVFDNGAGQPISPFSGRTLPRSDWHYPWTGIETGR
jgi:hypothetical protein